MAWEHFPVARGQRLTAAMLNELRDAAQERGLTVPAAVAAGDSTNDVYEFITSLRGQIETSVHNGWWWWVESWTDPVTYSIWKLSLDETDALATPPLKNVFEAAFGAGHTDWRKEGARLLEAQELNDIYLVLKKLKYIPAVNITGVIPQPGFWRSVDSVYATCSAALTALDSAPFISDLSFTRPFVIAHSTAAVRSLVSPYTWRAYQGYRAVFRGVEIPANASKLYLRWEARARREAIIGDSQGWTSEYYELARDQYGHLLYGQSPPPSDFYDTWGTYYETITFASGTEHHIQRVEKFDAPSEGNFYLAMYGDPSMNASGAGICGLGGDAYEQIGMADPLGDPPCPSLIEMNYTKS